MPRAESGEICGGLWREEEIFKDHAIFSAFRRALSSDLRLVRYSLACARGQGRQVAGYEFSAQTLPGDERDGDAR